MAHLQGKERSAYVQQMFGRIAKRYDLMNRLMTAGQDRKWRQFLVKQANVKSDTSVLDLATGTGDIAFEVLHNIPTARVIGADFTLPMMEVGRERNLLGDHVNWCGADALNLPFKDKTFDVVTSGYLLRNVPDVARAIREQVRVLKPGGRFITLDTSPPPNNILRPFIMIHLRYIIPLLGRLIVGGEESKAYQYLPESTQAFKKPQELVTMMQEAGLQNVGYKTFMFGTMAVHWGDKKKS